MSLAWAAGSVRATLLASRRLGSAGAGALAGRPSLEDALRELSASPYGREMTLAMTLEDAQRAVAAALLWHLRILAGWLPPSGGEMLRALAAWFEIANVQDRLAYLAGAPYRAPFELGGLGTAWPALSRTGSAEQVRSVLASSRWGDPGGSDPEAVVTGLRIAWAARVALAVPEASMWARSAAVLLLARALHLRQHGAHVAALGHVVGIDATRAAAGVDQLAGGLPADLRWVLAGIERADDLWLAEAAWWSRVESESARMVAARRHGRTTAVGVIGLLAADARRVRAALAAAALGTAAAEAFDAAA